MHVYTCMYRVFYMYIYLFILTSIYALKNTVINTKENIYFVHDMIYLSCLIALLGISREPLRGYYLEPEDIVFNKNKKMIINKHKKKNF